MELKTNKIEKLDDNINRIPNKLKLNSCPINLEEEDNFICSKIKLIPSDKKSNKPLLEIGFSL